MPICIECCYPVPQLYHVLSSSKHKPWNPTTGSSTANDKTPITSPSIGADSITANGLKKEALKATLQGGTQPKNDGTATGLGIGTGGDVRLTQCPRCKRFADKYVEHDFVVLFIDLVLVKPQVYRHLLFNRLAREDDEFDPSMKRLGVLLILFDVYLTWSSIESLPANQTAPSSIPHLPILLQYAFYLFYCTLTALAQHLTIRALAKIILPGDKGDKGASLGGSLADAGKEAGAGGGHGAGAGAGVSTGSGTRPTTPVSGRTGDSRPNAISTALFVSSCMKLFPILMIVWRYDDVGGQVGKGVEWAVALQNLEALRILLGCSYLVAGTLVGAGAICRIFVSRMVLGAVGLGGVDR